MQTPPEKLTTYAATTVATCVSVCAEHSQLPRPDVRQGKAGKDTETVMGLPKSTSETIFGIRTVRENDSIYLKIA